MTPPKALLISLLALVAPTTVEATEMTPSQRLAGQLTRASAALIETGTVSVRALDSSVLLAAEAARLDPTPDRWRTLLKLAELTERDELRSEALRALVECDKDDEVARLLFVNDWIERSQTVEQRVEAYKTLLAANNRQVLGPAVTSRLCEDLALLLDRCDDVDGFSQWLAEAMAVDPSNRSAAATAAGFFRANATDPYGEAELLTSLVMADPSSPQGLTMLAELLLEHGAYAGADRLYRVAARSQEVLKQVASEGLFADWAVAQWGHGDWQGALDTIQACQRRLDEPYRLKLRQADPTLKTLDLVDRHEPATTLSTVRAAIHNRRADDDAATSLAATMQAYDQKIDELAKAPETAPAELAERHLQAALVALWLGGEIETAERHLDAASTLLGDTGLSPAAEARFEGWVALRRDDPVRATELLSGVSNDDPAARLGLGLARQATGHNRDAARDLYAVYQGQPGTVMGVWAGDLLSEMLGQRVDPDPLVPRLEALVASIPSLIDRFPDEPTLAVSVRLLPAKQTFEPYEPVILNVEISNNAPMPLAIDDSGPIQPQLALIPSVQMAVHGQEARPTDVRPMIVDIGRRLRLEPWQRLVVPVDLLRGPLAQVLAGRPLRGATISVTGILSFRMTYENVLEPGILGCQVRSPAFRVDGVRVTTGWITDAIESILDLNPNEDLATIALLSHVVPLMKQVREEDPLRALDQFGLGSKQLENDATTVIIDAYSKLDPISRAWLLAVMPRRSPPLAPVYAMAQKDDDRYVKLVYLLFCLEGPDDPMIDAAIRGDDPDVRTVADMIRHRKQQTRGAE